MSRIPSDDGRNAVDHSGLPDQRVIEARANSAFRRKAAYRVEGLGRRESHQPRNGAQTFQCSPGLIGREAKGSVLAAASQRGIGLGKTVSVNGKACRVALGQQCERSCMMLMRLGYAGDYDVAVE